MTCANAVLNQFNENSLKTFYVLPLSEFSKWRLIRLNYELFVIIAIKPYPNVYFGFIRIDDNYSYYACLWGGFDKNGCAIHFSQKMESVWIIKYAYCVFYKRIEYDKRYNSVHAAIIIAKSNVKLDFKEASKCFVGKVYAHVSVAIRYDSKNGRACFIHMHFKRYST